MPTFTPLLKRELTSRSLVMLGAFLPVKLKDATKHAAGVKEGLQLAKLLNSVASDRHRPVLVLADENGTDPVRTKNAGRVTAQMGLTDAEWRIFADGANLIGKAVLEQYNVRVCFHPHCAGFVETPEEVYKFCSLTDPKYVNLTLDGGHVMYGSRQNDPKVLHEYLAKVGHRIKYVHCKDCEPAVAEKARAHGWDYFEAIKHGVFCELGKGCVDFKAIVNWQAKANYTGWSLIEQDVLPGMGAPKVCAQNNLNYLKRVYEDCAAEAEGSRA